jgi:magnesium transporter
MGADASESGGFLRSKLWWTGLLLMALGESGNFASYAFAPASLIAPLGSCALLANIGFAKLLLSEW